MVPDIYTEKNTKIIFNNIYFWGLGHNISINFIRTLRIDFKSKLPVVMTIDPHAYSREVRWNKLKNTIDLQREVSFRSSSQTADQWRTVLPAEGSISWRHQEWKSAHTPLPPR